MLFSYNYKDMEKLILIDGSSILYRAFFALPHFVTKKGEPTGAVYGFLQMLLRVLKDEHPEYLAVAFDKKAPTIRHISFEDYKANRPKTPDELVEQFSIVREALEAFNVKYFEIDGYEADDIIATAIEQLKSFPIEIYIVTGDMDLAQLISEKVKLLITRKGVSNIEIFDKEKVIENLKVLPEQVADLKALSGDVSDNIPGIPGVGTKTAAKLLQEFGSIEEIIDKIEQINNGKLKDYKDLLMRNKNLTRLRRDVPVNVELSFLKLGEFKNDNVNSILQRLEFKTILKELNFEIPQNSSPLLFNDQEKRVFIYFEKERNFPVKFYTFDGKNYNEYNIEEELFRNESSMAILKNIIEDTQLRKDVNDLKSLYKISNELNADPRKIFLDLDLSAFLIDPDSREEGIKFLFRLFGMNHEIENQEEKVKLSYSVVDRVEEELRKEHLFELFANIEKPLAKVLVEMEKIGIKIDLKYFKELEKEIRDEISSIEKKIFDLAGISFNILSSKQLSEILFEELGLLPSQSSKSGYSTSVSALEDIEEYHPIIPLIIEYRHLSKLLSSYIEPLPHIISKNDGKLHTNFHLIGTATGRLRSTNPNLQNIPIKGKWGERIRKGFVASNEESTLISADYSQIELRILAHLSEDPVLIKGFQEGQDIHALTASEIFKTDINNVTTEMRSIAKAINFATIYGVTPMGLSKQIRCSIEEAQEFIDSYFKKYSRVKEYVEKVIDNSRTTGETRTIFNRKRIIRGFESKNYSVRENAKRLAINSPIQGSAADIIKMAMVKLDDQIKPSQTKMLLQIHDELIFECPIEKADEATKVIREIMENSTKLKVPLEVNISHGKNLLEAKL